jgi:Tfp pilus assembly protein PilN
MVQWELRGLPVAAVTPRLFGLVVHPLPGTSPSDPGLRTLVVACPEDPLPPHLPARRHEASPLLRRPVPDGILLWREHGHWTALFSAGDAPVYFQVLTETRFEDHLLGELDAIRQSLILDDLIPPPRALEIESESWPDAALPPPPRVLGLPVSLRPTEGPWIPLKLSGVMPVSAAGRERRRLLMRRVLWGASGLAALWLVWLATSFLGLERAESDLARLRAEAIRDAPLVERIRLSRDLAEALRPAVDATLFPLEQFHLAVGLLPDEGVRLTHFEVDGDKILLRGEASNSAAAVAWRGKLRGSAAFQDFSWDFPQPEILPDNRARFVAQGTRTVPAYPAPAQPE